MLLRVKRGWEMRESEATPESVYLNRRGFLTGAAAGAMIAGAPGAGFAASSNLAKKLPARRNDRYALDRPITDEEWATTYNNFYEFGSHKRIADAAQRLKIDPWTIKIDGMVEKERTLDFDALMRIVDLEERLYRHRCVEAWAMAVPYTGFPMAEILKIAQPLSGAKYVRMETFEDADMAPGQKQFWYPWPYVEGVTMDEAAHELSFIAVGLYGKPIPKQNGAPLRLALPWKYGFKHLKSIVRFTFTDERPVSFWEEIQGSEYGFWANVNPKVAHPRWSQATERMLGSDERVPTLLYNGYGEFVADLYADKRDERLFM